MTANELRTKYLEFFKSKGHTIIPSASLVPRETDSSTLFTTAGMHPLVPYLLGEKHTGGTRLVDVQKCVRTGDIDDVGDNRHLTFFEMMGNWSLGDYFKKEAIQWSWEFLTSKELGLGLDPKRLYVTVFKGEDGIPRDSEAIEIWQKVFANEGMEAGIAGEDEIVRNSVRIIPLGKDDNFWIAGATGPCGGDTEMFYDTRPEEGKLEGKFGDLVDSFRLIEIWNDVFMEFNKTAEGRYEKLARPNVDTGMGVERTLAVLNGKTNVFETELFQPLFEKLAEISNRQNSESEETEKAFRIITDHIKSSVFIIADGVLPLNTGRGYVLRRLIRRAVRYGKLLGIEKEFAVQIAEIVIQMYGEFYLDLKKQREYIFEELRKEEQKFTSLLSRTEKLKEKELAGIYDIIYATRAREAGMSEEEILKGLNSGVSPEAVQVSAVAAFNLETTHGYPSDMFFEDLFEKTKNIDFVKESKRKFEEKKEEHQNLSRTASAGMFKGGLQDSGEETAKLHTATHLLLAALRTVLGNHVYQKGSNITAERLRLDFAHPEKMTEEQKAEVEQLVNATIEARLDVVKEEMSLEEARQINAMGVFDGKYGERVTVYSVVQNGEMVSCEICGGPHAKNTGELGHFKLQKEEASSAGVRRIKAILE